MYCREGVLVNQGFQKARAVTLKCRAWTCPECAPDRRKQLIALIASGKPERLITFTMRPEPGESPVKHARVLVNAFQLLMRELVRTGRCKRLQYAAVMEAHTSGYAHLHVAQRGGFIERNYLVKRWIELTGSWNVDIRYIRNPGDCAAYLAKYMGKDPVRFGTCKRYWTTNGWDLSGWAPHAKESGWSTIWEVRGVSIAWLADMWEGMGWTVIMDDGVLYGSAGPPPDGVEQEL